MQRSAGLYGSLIVDVAEGEREPFHYNGELNLLLSDWWHESVHHQEVGLSSKPFRWIGEPNVSPTHVSLLLLPSHHLYFWEIIQKITSFNINAIKITLYTLRSKLLSL